MTQGGKSEEQRRRSLEKWEEFSKTGRLGAYLAYRALAAREDSD